MKKKVLHLLSSSSFSGAENVAVNIIESLQDHYDFIYCSPSGSIRDYVESKLIKFEAIQRLNPFNLRVVFEKLKPDIVHAHDFGASVSMALSGYKCIKISHIHQNPPWIRKKGLYSSIYGLSMPAYSMVLAVSPEIIEEAVFLKKNQKKVNLLHNIVNLQKVRELSMEENKEERYDLAFLGRLSEVKDPIRFISIVKMIKKVKSDVKAVIVGDGGLRESCEREIITFGLQDTVTIKGFLNNPFPLIRNCKVVLNTSRWEGFGLAAVESMALGKPVFATPVGGLKSIVNENCGGVLEHDEDFSRSVLDVLSSPQNYNKLSNGALHNAEKFGDLNAWREKLFQFYG